MIRLQEVKLPCGSDPQLLEGRIRKILKLKGNESVSWEIARHSVDARKKPNLMDIYTVDVLLGKDRVREKKLVEKLRSGQVLYREPVIYQFPDPEADASTLTKRPVIVGSGPAGLFAALKLAQHGYRPVVLERGASMEERTGDVEHFWKTAELNTSSNIQFGEGGAGTYSDGKLTTNVKDKYGRNEEVLRIFIGAGAPEEIRTEYHPHIGTDLLRDVIVTMRGEIERLGGEVRFHAAVEGFETEGDTLKAVRVRTADGTVETLPTEVCILAPGHSARDTIRTLHGMGIPMTQKNFAIGFRVSHPQSMIDDRTYGISDREEMARLHLPSSSYKLVSHTESGRGVYSFCMCPGGYVVNASSEEGRLAVNGMSDFARDSARANSAIVMTVGAEDFGGEDILAGLHFQEKLEEKAYSIAGGQIPVEQFLRFEEACRKTGRVEETVTPLTEEETEALCLKGRSAMAPLHTLLPDQMNADFVEGMHLFERTIPGFAGPEGYVVGLESRTSSPVRITRNEAFESELKGLYPCGEGAGYAGGIMSAAIDGLKCAEAVGRKYRPLS